MKSLSCRTVALLLVLPAVLLCSRPGLARDCVVLLHGLARTADSMGILEERLLDEGFAVANIDYPSRAKPIEELAPLAVGQGIGQCSGEEVEQIHFVTHSLGGILVRYQFARELPAMLGRVVMLGPPNQGSEVVDRLGDMPGFFEWNGPAGMQLGTGPESVPRQLGPVNFELGVIAGTTSINLILSTFLPNPDDGKVSLESTRVEGMRDFASLPVSHPFIMQDDEVIDLVVSFLREGRFVHAEPEGQAVERRDD